MSSIWRTVSKEMKHKSRYWDMGYYETFEDDSILNHHSDFFFWYVLSPIDKFMFLKARF